MSIYDRSRHASYDIDEETGEALREIVTADYVVFLLAFDTYLRWLKQAEAAGMAIAEEDDLVQEGLALIKYLERINLDTIAAELRANLSSQASLSLLEAALRPPATLRGISLRTMKLRVLFTRNMTGVTKAIFGNSRKALQMVRDALEAAAIDDPDQALAKISVIDMKNPRLEKWVDKASETATPLGTLPVSPVENASKATRDSADSMFRARVEQAGAVASSDQTAQADDRQRDELERIQADATRSAEKALGKSGEDNKPVTKAEAIGVATAAVAAAMNDPTDQRNIPSMLKGLDPEQLSAAMSSGRVLVAAGAGSGKTHTLTSRVAYLVQDQGVDPSKILVCCFNTKAARELKERISARVGGEQLGQMAVGTMHSIFRRFVVEYGTPEQKAAVTTWLIGGRRGGGGEGERQAPSRGPSPGALGGYMSRVWKACKGEDPPRKATMLVQKWQMNDISPKQAAQMFPDKQEEAEWYEWWLGFKGVDKQWSPPCRDPKGIKQWQDFLSKYRDGGRARLGDFSDMILMFRDLLRDNPGAKKKIQGMFDHIAVDEAQDLNEIQHQIIDLLGEHIATDDPKRSLFAIGDESQSINAFAGARPDLFVGFQDKGFQLKNIATNYRCLPEIIELANNLMREHPLGLPLMARPDPKKPRGKASIVFHEPATHADAAIMTMTRIAQDVESGQPVGNYAVLTRTNREINDFETACIIQGIPYARRGSSSFLQSPETVTVMSYINLVTGQDYKKMQQALAKVLNNPNRWLGQRGEEERVIASAVEAKARRSGVSVDQVNPLDLFDREGVEILLQAIDPYRRMQDWQLRAAREQISSLGRALNGMRSSVDSPGDTPYTTQSLIGDILTIPGAPEGNKPVVLRDVLMPAGFTTEEEQDDTTEEEKEKPVGNVQFLFMLAQPTGKEEDPSNPRNFRARLEKLNEAATDLRVDLTAWDVAQQKLPPSERKNPPCVTLSTVHSVKGAQWPNVTVVMAPGVFPHRATDAGAVVPDTETDPALREARLEFLTERQLAYVAFTRAGEDLTVLSPHTNLNGQAGPTPRFVGEAGLTPGQNVAGKNDPTPSDTVGEGARTVLAWGPPNLGSRDEPEQEQEPEPEPEPSDAKTASSTYDRSWS